MGGHSDEKNNQQSEKLMNIHTTQLLGKTYMEMTRPVLKYLPLNVKSQKTQTVLFS